MWNCYILSVVFISVGALRLIFVVACISTWVAEAVHLANVS